MLQEERGTSEFVETGKVAKGYLGANSILLKNLIGDYPTDDHFVDFKVEAVNDNELRKRYVEYMDKRRLKDKAILIKLEIKDLLKEVFFMILVIIIYLFDFLKRFKINFNRFLSCVCHQPISASNAVA